MARAERAVTEEEIHHWACSTYCELLRQLPVLARGWRAGCERALTQRVDRLTSQHVSPLLLAEEFAKLQTADTTVDNMTVSTGTQTLRNTGVVACVLRSGIWRVLSCLYPVLVLD